MNNLYLKFPDINDKTEWIRYVKETKEDNPESTPGGFKEDTIYEEWLNKLYNQYNNINLEKGYVPSSFYFLMDGNRILGSISIRHSIDSEFLKKFGGHIGYNIRPSERKKGYATIMLRLALEKCEELGIEKVMVTCKENNIGSAKTIENNCGKLKEIVFIPEENCNFKKYWINVKEVLCKKSNKLGCDIMKKLVLVRHGESEWNLENKFTGWTDVDLSSNGIKEAIDAGKVLKEKGFSFDIAYTSVLKRANHTLDYILKELNEEEIPIYKSWRLNERHYGALQGLNKKETADKYGDEQVHLWRRSYDVKPPALEEDDERYKLMKKTYKEYIPHTECLKDTVERVIPYWENNILPSIKEGKKVIIVAHGNSLRGLIKYLDNMSDEEVVSLEIETGNPICYELDDNYKPIKHYYLK